MSKYLFGDIVVINGDNIGVVVKVYYRFGKPVYYYEIYNRMAGKIQEYDEEDVQRYRVRHKYLNEEE